MLFLTLFLRLISKVGLALTQVLCHLSVAVCMRRLRFLFERQGISELHDKTSHGLSLLRRLESQEGLTSDVC